MTTVGHWNTGYRDAVVEAIPDDLVLDLLPALERLVDDDLRRVSERLLGQRAQLIGIVGEAGPEAAESEGSADQNGVPKMFGWTEAI